MNLLVEPGLVDLEARIGQQAVAVEPLDIVAFIGWRPSPQMLTPSSFIGRDQHRAGHARDPSGVGVEVCGAAGRDMESAGLDGGDPFMDQLRAAIHQQGFFGAEAERLCAGSRRNRPRRAGRDWRYRAKARGASSLLHPPCSAALVSRPPENAIPTFCPFGQTFSGSYSWELSNPVVHWRMLVASWVREYQEFRGVRHRPSWTRA